MRDFFADQQILYTSERFDAIYQYFNKEKDLKLHDVFLMSAAIGSKNGKRVPRTGKGREFRTNYLSPKQRSMAFAILLTDKSLGRRFDEFIDPEFIKNAKTALEEYAEAGMEILVKDVFRDKWDGDLLDQAYEEYEIDLATYFMELLSE